MPFITKSADKQKSGEILISSGKIPDFSLVDALIAPPGYQVWRQTGIGAGGWQNGSMKRCGRIEVAGWSGAVFFKGRG
jgi:hypothetical protein